MGYIGQLPGRPDELPGRESGTGAPPEPGGPRADELPALLGTGTRSVSLTAPAQPVAPVDDSE